MSKKKYNVEGHVYLACSMTVYADSKKEAIEKANEEFGDLTNYVGMGGDSKLVGVCSCEDDREIYPDGEAVFDEAKEV